MTAAEFLAALNTVEQDHQLVMDKVQGLRETVSCLLDPARVDCRAVIDRLREFNNVFATQLEMHMEEEETTLFPLLEKHSPEGAEVVARLRAEHAEIRRRRQEFDNCLEIAIGLEDSVPSPVLRDLLVYGWDLWDFLDNHAHMETRSLHLCLTRSLEVNPAFRKG
jgi:hemerythrin-like domain-containing protein